MTEESARQTWEQILQLLDEKLQYGFLEQAKSVVQVALEGNELVLTVTSEEADEFFNSEVNGNRLALLCRPVAHIESVKAKLIDAEPLE